MSKFNYARNVRDLDKTAADLEAHGFAETTLHDLSEALAILSKDELKAIVKERSMQNSIDSSAVSTVGVIFASGKQLMLLC